MRLERRSSRNHWFVWIFFPLLLGGIGIGISVSGMLRILESERVRQGMTAMATIDAVRPTEWRGGKGSRHYGIEIQYSFEHQGTIVVGHRIGMTRYSVSRSSTRDRKMAQFQIGSPVKVFYEPSSPGRAVIDPAPNSVMLALPLLGTGLALLGFVIPLFIRSNRYARDELPFGTHESAEGSGVFAIGESGARRQVAASITMLVIAAAGVICAVGVTGNAPSAHVGLMVAMAIMVAAAIFGLILGFRVSPAGAGNLVVDSSAGQVMIRNLLGRGARSWAFEDVTDIRAEFKPMKGAMKPEDKNAVFCPKMTVLDAEKGQRDLELSRFTWRREDARELVGWLRDQLALGPESAAESALPATVGKG